MGFKKMDTNIGFADFALDSSLKHNRSLKLMEKLDNAIDWTKVETILLSHYTVGTARVKRDDTQRMCPQIGNCRRDINFEGIDVRASG